MTCLVILARGRASSIVSTVGLRVFLRVDRDDAWQSVDSTINRVHRHGSGGCGGAEANAIGRSRGGLSTKVHLVVDALGLPLAFDITEGQRHDSVPAADLVARSEPKCLLADKAYDSDAFRHMLAQMNCQPVIPPTASRSGRVSYDEVLYEARSEVECTFGLLEQARRFATRYEKTLRNDSAIVAVGCALLWLRI